MCSFQCGEFWAKKLKIALILELINWNKKFGGSNYLYFDKQFDALLEVQ